MSNNLLINEHPLILLPGLAKSIGLNEAIVLQQIHFLLGMKVGGRIINGEKWVWNTLEQWRLDHFPFFSIMTLRRTIASLENLGVLISCQPDGRMSRKKYYRIDHEKLDSVSRCVQNEHIDMFKMNTSKTETTTRDYKTKETEVPTETSAGRESQSQHKEQQLTKIKTPDEYPSEDEFNDFLESEQCNTILDARDLYTDLCQRKWHHWNPKVNRWRSIRDWKKYVSALETTMQAAKSK